jgi:hypothetical protein
MTRPADELVHALLDGESTEAGRQALGAQVAADPDAARSLARAALLHDALEREFVAAGAGRASARRTAFVGRLRRLAAVVALAAAVGAVVTFATRGQPALAADTELARIAARPINALRTYVIHADDHKDGRAPKGPAQGRARGRFDATGAVAPPRDMRPERPKPSIDEAVLHVGATGSYVLVRTAADGTETVSGSDGASAWSFSGRGAVRTSRDPARFRGALPGHQHDLPFVDPVDGLRELAHSYDVAFERAGAIDAEGLRTIVATRRIDAQRGPKVVRIDYDPRDASVVRMRLERLPQAQGGPRAVTFELVGESRVEPGFFGHEAHHAPGRQVIKED